MFLFFWQKKFYSPSLGILTKSIIFHEKSYFFSKFKEKVDLLEKTQGYGDFYFWKSSKFMDFEDFETA